MSEKQETIVEGEASPQEAATNEAATNEAATNEVATSETTTSETTISKPARSIVENDVVDGKVVNIRPFGAVVELGDKRTGLVHISQISNDYVQDVNDYVSVGEVVTVKVLSIDEKNNRISLTMRESDLNPDSAPARKRQPRQSAASFEEKFKDWQRLSNDRHASINRRNKRR